MMAYVFKSLILKFLIECTQSYESEVNAHCHFRTIQQKLTQ